MNKYTDYLIYASTTMNIVYYIPQFYAIYTTKNVNYYDIFPLILLNISSILLICYSIEIENDELFVNNTIMLMLSSLELLFVSYYAHYNKYSSTPHEKFQEQINEMHFINEQQL